MQFNSILVLLLFMITFIQTLQGRTCDCSFCFDDVIVGANREFRLSNSNPCPAGQAAAVSEINVESTDGSGFQVYTKDDPLQSEYYIDGSITSTVTCFKMRGGIYVGGRKSRIYVVLSCEELSQSCSLRYSIDMGCVPVGTTSTAKSTSVSTAKSTSAPTAESTSTSTVKPVNPSTVTAKAVNNTCECQCCKGSSACVPVYAGTIFYGANTCEASNCARQCAKQFSDCPVDGNQPGVLEARCKNNAGITLKSPFYIPLLMLFIYIYIYLT